MIRVAVATSLLYAGVANATVAMADKDVEDAPAQISGDSITILQPLTAEDYGRAFCTGSKDGKIYFGQDRSGEYGILKVNNKLSPMARMNGRMIDFDNIPWLGADTVMRTTVVGDEKTIIDNESGELAPVTVLFSFIAGTQFGQVNLELSCGL